MLTIYYYALFQLFSMERVQYLLKGNYMMISQVSVPLPSPPLTKNKQVKQTIL